MLQAAAALRGNIPGTRDYPRSFYAHAADKSLRGSLPVGT